MWTFGKNPFKIVWWPIRFHWIVRFSLTVSGYLATKIQRAPIPNALDTAIYWILTNIPIRFVSRNKRSHWTTLSRFIWAHTLDCEQQSARSLCIVIFSIEIINLNKASGVETKMRSQLVNSRWFSNGQFHSIGVIEIIFQLLDNSSNNNKNENTSSRNRPSVCMCQISRSTKDKMIVCTVANKWASINKIDKQHDDNSNIVIAMNAITIMTRY